MSNTFIFSALSKCRSRFGKRSWGESGSISPPSLLQTVNENYEQGTTDTESQSGQEGFMSSQSDNNYKIENGEKKSFTLQQGTVISIIYVFHTNHILIFVAFDNLEESPVVCMDETCRLRVSGRQTIRYSLALIPRFCCHT